MNMNQNNEILNQRQKWDFVCCLYYVKCILSLTIVNPILKYKMLKVGLKNITHFVTKLVEKPHIKRFQISSIPLFYCTKVIYSSGYAPGLRTNPLLALIFYL